MNTVSLQENSDISDADDDDIHVGAKLSSALALGATLPPCFVAYFLFVAAVVEADAIRSHTIFVDPSQ